MRKYTLLLVTHARLSGEPGAPHSEDALMPVLEAADHADILDRLAELMTTDIAQEYRIVRE